MWECPDNQNVGLEAATIERVRNSLLVDMAKAMCSCADNVRGLKPTTEAREAVISHIITVW